MTTKNDASREAFRCWLKQNGHHNPSNLYPVKEITPDSITDAMEIAWQAAEDHARAEYAELIAACEWIKLVAVRENAVTEGPNFPFGLGCSRGQIRRIQEALSHLSKSEGA